MKICGVIAEYNPFHNGHAYHLSEARRLSGCDYLIVVMGGAFSQRGEVMLLDKWTRARMALENGADMVVELPALFAVRSADMFARGGVNILSGLGAQDICFGSEIGDIALLERMLDMLEEEDEQMQEALHARLSQGMSHVRARGEALSQRLGVPPEVIGQPNAALALEYMRSNRRLERPMRIHAVLRRESYHDEQLSSMASASAIRAAIGRGEADLLENAMPPTALSLLRGALGGRISDMTRLDALLLDRLRSMTALQLEGLCDVSEGLENRLLKCAEMCGSREALLTALKCKRYTHARLSRLCAHALLGVTKEMAARHPLPGYARVLGFRREAGELLRQLAGAHLPLVSRPSQLREDEVFRLEMRATDLQSLCFADETARSARRDLTEKMLVV